MPEIRRRHARCAPVPWRGRMSAAVLGGFLLAALVACDASDGYRHLSGNTMGTYYQVTAHCASDPAAVVERTLEAVDGEMSTYREDSALSRFNRAPVGEWVEVPGTLADVIAAAETLSAESDGAFDVTVGRLVNLWGFGPEPRDGVPAPADVAAARDRVGHRHVTMARDPPRLRKDLDVYVDLSAIAKGHGVDRVVEVLAAFGCDAVLVDIGGEVRGVGASPAGRPWRIGVEVPDPRSHGGIERIVVLENAALATSGDYRNFFQADGRRYSHTIDPSTGYPVTHDLASVTVLHESTMWADGYATLLDVLGPERGYEFAARHGLAALFISRREDGFEERYTDAFAALLID